MLFLGRLFRRKKQYYCAFCQEEIINDAFEKYQEKFCSKKHAKRFGDRKRRREMETEKRKKMKKTGKKNCCK
jgi:hypothetical protein